MRSQVTKHKRCHGLTRRIVKFYAYGVRTFFRSGYKVVTCLDLLRGDLAELKSRVVGILEGVPSTKAPSLLTLFLLMGYFTAFMTNE